MTNLFDDLRLDNFTIGRLNDLRAGRPHPDRLICRRGPQKCSCAPTDIIKHFRRDTPRLYKDAVGDSDAIGQVLIASLHGIDE